MQNLYIASDHAGFKLKEAIICYWQKKDNLLLNDLGTDSTESCNYAHFALQVVQKLRSDHSNALGILICATGVGMSMASNKFKGIRAALCFNEEMGRLAREHNNANILCLGAAFIKENLANRIVDHFLQGKFQGGRHSDRLAIFDQLGS